MRRGNNNKIKCPRRSAIAQAGRFAIFVIAFFSVPGVALAQGSGASPNQSVDLEKKPAAGIQPEVKHPVSGSEGAKTANVDAESTPPTSNAPTLSPFLRRRSANASSETSGANALPWYRSAPGALSIVLGIIAITAWSARRWLPRSGLIESGKVMRVAARTELDAKHTLALVQVGRRFVMLGICPDRTEALAQFTDLDEVLELAALTGTGLQSTATDFGVMLNDENARYVNGPVQNKDNVRTDRGKSPAALTDLLGRLKAKTAESS